MPMFCLNTSQSPIQFYCDNGDIRSALSVAEPTEFVRLIYFSGYNEFSGRNKFIRHNKASTDLEIMMSWQLAETTLKMLMTAYIHSVEFVIEFDSGMMIDCSGYGDTIIYFKDDKRINDIFKAFNVPKQVHPLLLSQSGSLFSVILRSGEYRYFGYFKNIKTWLRKNEFDKTKHAGFYPVNMN